MFSFLFNQDEFGENGLYCSIIFGKGSILEDSYDGKHDITYINTKSKDSWEISLNSFKIFKTKRDFFALNFKSGSRYVLFEPSSPYMYIPLPDY